MKIGLTRRDLLEHMNFNSALTILLVTLLNITGRAQSVNLQDYPGTFHQNGFPKDFTPFNGKVFFNARTQDNGEELWVTDGTLAGTKMFLEIGAFNLGAEPKEFTVYNGELYFVARDWITTEQIWKTDGTPEGTVPVTNFTQNYYPENLIVANGLLFFTCGMGNEPGAELWKTDGTNYSLVKDINPTPNSGGLSLQPDFAVTTTHLYFTANDLTHGTELWKTDGTEAGTVLVSDIHPGVTSTFNSDDVLISYNNTIFFPATTGGLGSELWKSDGTEAGTILVAEVNPIVTFPNISELTVSNGLLFFTADNGTNGNELWKSDGTTAGTQMVKDIYVGSNSSDPASLYDGNGTLYFSAFNTGSGFELYKSDGTLAGTVLVKDIFSGVNASNPTNFSYCLGAVYFSASASGDGAELYKTNGTTAGTVLVKSTLPGIASGGPSGMTEYNGKILFQSRITTINNAELWISDGTTAGTVLLRDICANEESSEISSKNLLATDHRLYFTGVSSNSGRELWSSDGTQAGTALLKDLYTGANSGDPYHFSAFDTVVYFFGQTGLSTYNALIKTNGTLAGTNALSGTLNNLSIPMPVFEMNDTLYFFTNNTPSRLYRVNPTGSPTLVTNINGGIYEEADPLAVDTVFYFSCNGNSVGDELYRSNGKASGTYLVKNIYPGGVGSYPDQFTLLNGSIIFVAEDAVNGRELWKTDGTSAGTVLLSDIYPGAESSSPNDLFIWENRIYFSAKDPIYGRELWSTDGTPSGTHLEEDLEPGALSSNPLELTPGPGHFWFTANKTGTGRELWKKVFGQNAAIVSDIYPGAAASNPAGLKLIHNVLYFSANNGINGYEPYSTIFSGCSTTLLDDLNPGDLSSYPEFIGSVNGHIVMRANKAGFGRELFSLEEAEQVTEEVSTCGSYNWPLTNQTYTTSGSYAYITQNQSGCDSIVSLNLTIIGPSNGIHTQQQCGGSYTWIDGITYTSSTNSPTFTFTNTQGCDSVVTLHLMISGPSSGVDHQSHCGSYTWIDGMTYFSSTNSPTWTLENANGCDSIVTLNLTITNPPSSFLSVTQCDSYTLNNQTYTSSGVYTQNVQNAAGCDSTITLSLTITNPTSSSLSATACNSYTLNNQTYTSSGTYIQYLLNSAGCDSILTLNLTINESTTSSFPAVSCGPYFWELAQQTYQFSGSYPLTIQSSTGCDSTVTLSLLIHSVPTGQITDNGDGTLTATGGDNVRWINCTTGQPISGANSSTFTPVVNGSYAAIVDIDMSCEDTTDCVTINNVGISESLITSLEIYPNPTNNLVTISFEGNEAELIIYDAHGKLIQNPSSIHSGEQVSLKDVETGVYFFEIMTAEGKTVKRVVKN